MKINIPFFKLILSFLLFTGTTLGAFAQVQELSAPVKSGVNRMTKFGEQLIAYEANGNKTIYKLDAATQQWVNISGSSFSSISSTYHLNVVAGQGDYLFAGFDYNGIYRSDDQGESWLKTSNGIENHYVYTIQFDGTDLYIGTNVGIFKSSDDGISWTNYTENLLSAKYEMILFTDNYLYTSANGTLYATADAGATWNNVHTGLASTFKAKEMFEFSGHQFVAGYDQNILKLARRSDHNSTWEEATTDIALDTVEVINYKVIDNQLLALSDKGFFQYDLQNYSWTPITIDEAGHTTHQFFSDGQDLYRMTNYDLLQASHSEVFASFETQVDWNRMNEGFSSLPVYDLVNFDDKLYAGTPKGIFETAAGASYDWHITSNTATEIKTLLKFDTLLLAGSKYHLYVSSDSAKTWQSVLAKGTYHLFAFEDKLYAATSNGVYISEDTAQTWNVSNIGLTNAVAYEFAAIGTTLFVRSNDDIYRSTDKGVIWEKLNVKDKVNDPFINGDAGSLSATSDMLIVNYPFYDKLVTSDDMGENWVLLNDSYESDQFHLFKQFKDSERSAASNELIASAASSDHSLYISINNGLSWNQIDWDKGLEADSEFKSLFIYNDNIYFSVDSHFYALNTATTSIPAKPVLTEVALDKGMNDHTQPTKLNLRWEVDPEAEQIVVKSLISGGVDTHFADASLGQDSVSYNSSYSKKLAVYLVKNNIYSEPYLITPMEEWTFLYTHSYYDYSTNPETEKKYLRWGIAKDYDTNEVITDTVQIFVSSDDFQTYADGYEGYITNGVKELESEIGEGNKADWLDVPGGMYKGKARYKRGIYYGGFTNFDFEAPEKPEDKDPGVLGTDEFSTAQSIALYPNPTENNKLSLDMSGLKANYVEAEIFNSVGNKINTKTLKSEGTQLSHTFELTGLPAGIYFIKLSTDEQTDTIRFIKKD